MMTNKTLLAVALAASIGTGAFAVAAPANAQQLSSGQEAEAGITWRCGKNNAAMWGTFLNGCLKQKRAAKKATSAAVVPQSKRTLKQQR